MKQSEEFLRSEGDSFYQRNLTGLTQLGQRVEDDRIVNALQALGVRPRRILEIGCLNGWRLELMRKTFGAGCCGIDPSSAAIAAGNAAYPEISLRTGTADQLPYETAAFDAVVFGFCLYLCDRQDLFRIAAEADRVLAQNGHLAILDFSPPFAYRNEYKHRAGMYAYKMDYAAMFLWNPAYTRLAQSVFGHGTGGAVGPDDRVSVVILRKDLEHAYIDSPFTSEHPDG
jgi:ubiquinone/menaquinone biosynthesis C-methylase UbiE